MHPYVFWCHFILFISRLYFCCIFLISYAHVCIFVKHSNTINILILFNYPTCFLNDILLRMSSSDCCNIFHPLYWLNTRWSKQAIDNSQIPFIIMILINVSFAWTSSTCLRDLPGFPIKPGYQHSFVRGPMHLWFSALTPEHYLCKRSGLAKAGDNVIGEA